MNATESLRVTNIKDHGDNRGIVFPLPSTCIDFLGSAVDFNIMTLKPGHIRGNHFHAFGREVLVVVYSDGWSLHWDTGPDTATQREEFSGAGAVAIEIERLCSHAIRNDGKEYIHIVHIRNTKYDPEKPDAISRLVVS